MELGEADQAAWDAGGHAILKDVTMTGTRGQIRQRLDEVAALGVTEIVFQPAVLTPEPSSSGSSTRRPPDRYPQRTAFRGTRSGAGAA